MSLTNHVVLVGYKESYVSSSRKIFTYSSLVGDAMGMDMVSTFKGVQNPKDRRFKVKNMWLLFE